MVRRAHRGIGVRERGVEMGDMGDPVPGTVRERAHDLDHGPERLWHSYFRPAPYDSSDDGGGDVVGFHLADGLNPSWRAVAGG